jgi:hypothetical protein
VPIAIERYVEQVRRWPRAGRVILAAFDDESVTVYQAYRPSIGSFAAHHGRFGGEFSFERMTWIKPGFLWMMYRSGWGQKQGQEVVLAVSIRRSAFDRILSAAVHSSFQPAVYASRDAWQSALRGSDVRLQWDPDHGPRGEKLERRAIQLGLRGAVSRRYASEWIVGIEDISSFVAIQRARVLAGDEQALETPREAAYPVADAAVAARLGVETAGSGAAE